jgi:hypothetical protein
VSPGHHPQSTVASVGWEAPPTGVGTVRFVTAAPRDVRRRAGWLPTDQVLHPEVARFRNVVEGDPCSGSRRTRFWPNEHEPWPLHRASVVSLRDDLVGAAGLPFGLTELEPDSVLYSPGVTTRFGRGR